MYCYGLPHLYPPYEAPEAFEESWQPCGCDVPLCPGYRYTCIMSIVRVSSTKS